MNFKPLIIFLLLSFVVVANASQVHEFSWGASATTAGNIIEDDNEFMLDSEASRRTLVGRSRYISYGALRANQVPCGQRGRSYYNCQQRGRANPYKRACTTITHCQRFTD